MTAKHAPSDSASRQRHRLVIWLGVVTLLLSLMSPLVAIQTASAQDNLAERLQGEPPNCEPGFVVDEATNTCVPDPNAQPQDQDQQQQSEDQQQPLQCPEGQIPNEAGTECVPDQSQQQPPQDLQPQDEQQTQQQPVSLYVQKWECPAGYNVQAEDLAGLGPCVTPASTSFQMTIGTPSGETATQPIQEFWELANVPAGQYWLSEQVPEGYAQPAAWCTIYDPTVGPTAPQLYAFQPDGRVYFDIPPGMALYCNWYNVAIQQDNTATVYKWECAPGTEYGQSLDYYQGGLPDQETGPCETEHLNVPISLIDANGPRDTTTQANGTQWENVTLDQNGSFQVTVDEPAGYGDPMVFCGTLDQDTQSPQTATGGAITLSPTAEPFDYQCNWYNIPVPYGQIVVEKYWCPPGLAFIQTPTQADMQAACQETGSGASFELSGPEGSPQMWEVKSPEGGPPPSVFWDQLPAGLYTVYETGLDDTWTYTVYCHESAGVTNGAAPQMQELVDGNAIQWQLQAGYTLSCAWFNQPAADGNTVTVYKWDCAEGTEYGQNLPYYQGEGQDTGPCETEHLNVPISLIDANGQRDTTTQANGTQWDNVVLNNGSLQIAIDEPDGYGDPMVFCGTLDQDTQTAVPAPGGTFTLTPTAQPFDYQCNAYDIPVEGNTVTVYKWECAPGTEYGQSLEYYQGGLPDQETGPCESEHLNVPISLIDANGPRDTTTQANGTQWENVVLDQNGSFQVTVEEPAGYGDPMVFCGTLDQDTQDLVIATGGTITLSPTTTPFDYQCNWYNILFEGEYQLEVHKYLCAYDVDPTLGLPDLGTSCPRQQGVSFTATFGTTPTSARYTDATGQIVWTDAPAGDWTLQETVLPGWGTPKVYCGPPATTEAPEVPVVDLTVSGTLDSTNPHIICSWFNFELEQQNGRITLYKYQCPPGSTSTDFLILQESCTIPFNGVNFDLQMDGTTVSASTIAGTIDWLDLEQGTYTVREHLLPGYEQPLVWCGYVMQDGANIDPANQEFTSYPVTDASIQLALNNFPARIVCYWYNLPVGPGEITLYKWLCPPGYDLAVWGADPKVDCTTTQNGVTFTLDQPEGVGLITNTGDSIDGAVYFGGLAPGTYTVTETVPPETASVFVLDCTGTNIPKVHQYPLSWGNKLEVNLAADDKIVCNWYNVPMPDNGWLIVYKYQCWTPTFTAAVNCEIYEFGASFELLGVPGGTSYGTGTTNAMGVYTWNDLPERSYTLDEFSQTPCKVTSTKVDGSGNARVDAGEGTTIKVYNCTSPTTPTPTSPGVTPTPVSKVPGKVPGKYPNTGAEPNMAQEFMPAAALQGTPEGTPQDEALVDEYYRISCLEEPLEPLATPTAADETAIDPTETPEEFELAIETEVSAQATPGATPGAEEACPRGALPERVQIDAISVDAGVETLEIIDGVMQQPTGPNVVAWYKETGRLGEPNNVVMAGHLNWWNVPEGVFFRLQDLQEGDRVEVTGDDGRVYVYEVQWVRQESNLEPPAADVIGPTEESALTLITCGGEWNADIAEYDARTVVRAVQVDVLEPEASASAAAFGERLDA